MNTPRILIVAENVSARFGGEAFLPLHYFRVFRSRRCEVFILTHERVKRELQQVFPGDLDRIHFIPDTPSQIALYRAGAKLPKALDEISLDALRQFITQRMLRAQAKELVSRLGIDVVHQPYPVSPRRPSALYDIGAPVVIGPMNGNMRYPPGFATNQGVVTRTAVTLGRQASEFTNRLVPGKPKAKVLIVSNQRTREALPHCTRDVPVVELVENGVDLALFKRPVHTPTTSPPGHLKLVFVGRLVDWKAVDLLLRALTLANASTNVFLDIVGDGDQRTSLEALTRELNIADKVRFWGFLPQADVASRLETCDALILSSLFECGGAVVLEAMAKGLPVIATNWGGPADYLDDSCGILVNPDNPSALIHGLKQGMERLAADPALRRRMGEAGRAKIEREYDWERKADRMLEIYAQALS